MNGDVMNADWNFWSWGNEPLWSGATGEQYEVGHDYSVFDAEGDGQVENPVADTPAEVQALDAGSTQGNLFEKAIKRQIRRTR
jgi:hypothetical protein